MLWDASQTSIYSEALGAVDLLASQWFHLQWPSSLQTCPIATKELISVVIAAAISVFISFSSCPLQLLVCG